MHQSIQDIIRSRRSVRTYNPKPLTQEDRQKLEAFLPTADNPFGLAVEFRFLEKKTHGLHCPVTVGDALYIGAKAALTPHMEVAVGYSFERLVLFAESLGLGTVILGGTMNRPAFEKAMALNDGEVMPLATPIGYPAEKMSLRETMMRKGVQADMRMDFRKLFFDDTFDCPLTMERAGIFAQPLEMVRLAPSAVNRQPWRVLVRDGFAHFYEKPSKGMGGGAWDIQKIDVGIAMAHFALTLEEQGFTPRFRTDEPQTAGNAEGMVYIGSYGVE